MQKRVAEMEEEVDTGPGSSSFSQTWRVRAPNSTSMVWDIEIIAIMMYLFAALNHSFCQWYLPYCFSRRFCCLISVDPCSWLFAVYYIPNFAGWIIIWVVRHFNFGIKWIQWVSPWCFNHFFVVLNYCWTNSSCIPFPFFKIWGPPQAEKLKKLTDSVDETGDGAKSQGSLVRNEPLVFSRGDKKNCPRSNGNKTWILLRVTGVSHFPWLITLSGHGGWIFQPGPWFQVLFLGSFQAFHACER